jgi:AbrB family looped-hinge helix DNA binding protein
MSTTLTSKGQVTIPKRIRDTLGLGPGSQVEFDVDEQGRIIIRKAAGKAVQRARGKDRFDRVRGRATVKWTTDELMRLLRGDE